MAEYVYLDLPRSEMIPFVPEAARQILDVGCGRGGFGRALKESRPVTVTGVESDLEAASTAAGRYDRLVTGRFPGDIPDDSRFDCIVFNDILEHFIDPWEALKAARGMLNPGGAVIASIPNMRYWPVLWRLLVHGEWQYADSGVLDRSHLRFFTRHSIHTMFEEAGFAVGQSATLNPVDVAQLEPSARRVLAMIRRMKPSLERELRAQQFAVVASPNL